MNHINPDCHGRWLKSVDRRGWQCIIVAGKCHLMLWRQQPCSLAARYNAACKTTARLPVWQWAHCTRRQWLDALEKAAGALLPRQALMIVAVDSQS